MKESLSCSTAKEFLGYEIGKICIISTEKSSRTHG